MANTSADPKAAGLKLIRAHRDNIDKQIELRDRAIRGIHADGHASLREIADAAGVSHQTVANIIDRQ